MYIYVCMSGCYEEYETSLVTTVLDKAINHYVEKSQEIECTTIQVWENDKFIFTYGDLTKHDTKDFQKIHDEIKRMKAGGA